MWETLHSCNPSRHSIHKNETNRETSTKSFGPAVPFEFRCQILHKVRVSTSSLGGILFWLRGTTSSIGSHIPYQIRCSFVHTEAGSDCPVRVHLKGRGCRRRRGDGQEADAGIPTRKGELSSSRCGDRCACTSIVPAIAGRTLPQRRPGRLGSRGSSAATQSAQQRSS